MNKINCLIVDDEQPAIELLEKYVSLIDQLNLVGTSQSAIKAYDLLKKTKVDILFLDIRMPVLNGIDFAKSLKNPPSVILTTAYREYALEGFELDVIDYLLKPIEFDRFLRAVDKFIDRKLSTPKQMTPMTSSSDHIYFNVNKTNHKVLLDNINYIESLKDYVRIHTTEEKLIVKGNIGSIMKKLPTHRFIRIHRSYAIALARLKSYNQREVDIEIAKLPIGISYRSEVASKFGNKS